MTGRGLAVDVQVSWLTAPWWDALSLAERGVYVSALAYSQQQMLDGWVPKAALRFIDGDQTFVAQAMSRLVELGRAEVGDGGWLLPDWTGMQAQRSAAEINEYRRKNRERQARSRSKKTEPALSSPTGNATVAVTEDVTRYAMRQQAGDVGKGREAEAGLANARAALVDDWPVTPIGQDHLADELI